LSVAAAVLIGLLAAGCSSGGPTTPGATDAGWDTLTLRASGADDTLTVRGDGTLIYTELGGASARDGVVSATRMASLREAVERAELQPLTVGLSFEQSPGETPAAGRIELVHDAEILGLVWESLEELTPAERDLVDELEEVRRQAAGDGAEMVEAIPTEWLLDGYDARVAGPTAILVRNGDALLNLIRTQLGGRVVALPQIDFDTEMVVAVFAGTGVRTGSRVQVDVAVSRTLGGYLQVPVTIYEPEEECTGLTGNSPFDLVRLRRMDLEVFFLWDRIAMGCR
jgi:hypothetical protein